MLGKIASIVQQNLGNLSGGISGLVDSVKNSAQTNAAAAKILNKSPLEISDTSPTQHLKQNPYEMDMGKKGVENLTWLIG